MTAMTPLIYTRHVWICSKEGGVRLGLHSPAAGLTKLCGQHLVCLNDQLLRSAFRGGISWCIAQLSWSRYKAMTQRLVDIEIIWVGRGCDGAHGLVLRVSDAGTRE